jgi:hypothetical protein
MISIERVAASAATRAATGITHYMFDASGGWKAFGANDTEIVTHTASKEPRGKGVLRVDTHDRRVEITYSIEVDNNIVIDAVVNGVPSKVTFSKDGELVGEGLKKTLDPTINETFRSISGDLKAQRAVRSTGAGTGVATAAISAYCGGLLDAYEGAWRAGEFLSCALINRRFIIDCT